MSSARIARRWLWVLCLAAGAADARPAFLVAAPDRGFTGNEVVRDAFAALDAGQRAALVFVTADATAERLDRALAALRQSNAEPVVVLPFYLSAAHPDMAMLDAWADDSGVVLGRPFGRSAPALAALEARLRAIDAPAGMRLVLIGHGAKSEAQTERMERDLTHLLDAAARGMGFAATEALVWAEADGAREDALGRRLAALDQGGEGARTALLPFHLGPRLDAMMGFTPRLHRAAPESLAVLDAPASLEPAIARWLSRESTRYLRLPRDEIGVVVHAHGSNWHWNETMRRGASPLADDYLVEYAFSMGDPATIEHAVRHLEERGARAVVIVRVFGMASSFRRGIARFIGAAWETCTPAAAMHHHGHHGGGHGMDAAGIGMARPPALLETRLPVVTVGGLEDHLLFAEALYQRALALSESPARETVVLVAHGLGNEQGNAHWRDVLASIREQMLEMGGDRFRAIEIALWSEDWPELRRTAVEHVRRLVERGNEDNGRVIVVPARTLGQGGAKRHLEGLDFVLGEGFAPHPLFADWLRAQARAGVERLRYTSKEGRDCTMR